MDVSFDYVRRIVPATETMIFVPGQWWLANASIDLYFSQSLYYDSSAGGEGQAVTSYLSCIRASPGFARTVAGTLTSFGTNILRITDLGLLVEDARTNVVLWNQDLTNAAWTKTNVTAALDQTGPDGATNSASSILATAGNATVLQAITLGSSARYQSAWVKRITGSGTINMTMDNGSTWTAVTVSSSWTLVEIPTQTLANPTVGFRIVTNGDAIAVDFVQNEDGVFASSPIATTTVALARAADAVTLTGTADTLLSTLPFSIVLDIIAISPPGVSYFPTFLGTQPGSYSFFDGFGDDFHVRSENPFLQKDFSPSLYSTGVKVGHAASAGARSLTGGGLTPATDATGTAGTSGGITLGSLGGPNYSYAYYPRLTLWNSKLADAALQAFTT